MPTRQSYLERATRPTSCRHARHVSLCRKRTRVLFFAQSCRRCPSTKQPCRQKASSAAEIRYGLGLLQLVCCRQRGPTRSFADQPVPSLHAARSRRQLSSSAGVAAAVSRHTADEYGRFEERRHAVRDSPRVSGPCAALDVSPLAAPGRVAPIGCLSTRPDSWYASRSLPASSTRACLVGNSLIHCHCH
jgi:hypothetical protein